MSACPRPLQVAPSAQPVHIERLAHGVRPRDYDGTQPVVELADGESARHHLRLRSVACALQDEGISLDHARESGGVGSLSEVLSRAFRHALRHTGVEETFQHSLRTSAPLCRDVRLRLARRALGHEVESDDVPALCDAPRVHGGKIQRRYAAETVVAEEDLPFLAHTAKLRRALHAHAVQPFHALPVRFEGDEGGGELPCRMPERGEQRGAVPALRRVRARRKDDGGGGDALTAHRLALLAEDGDVEEKAVFRLRDGAHLAAGEDVRAAVARGAKQRVEHGGRAFGIGIDPPSRHSGAKPQRAEEGDRLFG